MNGNNLNVGNWEYLGINRNLVILLIFLIACLFTTIMAKKLFASPKSGHLFLIPILWSIMGIILSVWKLFRFRNTSFFYIFYLDRELKKVILLGNYLFGNKPQITVDNQKYRLIKIFDLEDFVIQKFILVDLLLLPKDTLFSVNIRKSPLKNWILENVKVVPHRYQ